MAQVLLLALLSGAEAAVSTDPPVITLDLEGANLIKYDTTAHGKGDLDFQGPRFSARDFDSRDLKLQSTRTVIASGLTFIKPTFLYEPGLFSGRRFPL